MKVVVVTAGRTLTNRQMVWTALDKEQPDLVIHGGAMGGDSLASDWCRKKEVSELRVPAKWNKHGKAAGPIRNSEMVDIALNYFHRQENVTVLSFPGGAGTADMTSKCQRAGLNVVLVTE